MPIDIAISIHDYFYSLPSHPTDNIKLNIDIITLPDVY